MERIRAQAWMLCLVLTIAFIVQSAAAGSKPNIILLYIDDRAWNGTPVAMDDGMENSRMPVLRMPNVERLAREGMKFRNAYMAGREPDEGFLNRNLYFHYPHYRSTMPHSAMVSGTKKVMHFYGNPGIPMLFDLSKDPGEVHHIAAEQPEEHRRMLTEMMDYFKEVGARIPKPNPDYDPAVYKVGKEHQKRAAWGPSKAAVHSTPTNNGQEFFWSA